MTAEKSINLRIGENGLAQLDWMAHVFGSDRSKTLRSVIPLGEHGEAVATYARWSGFQGEFGTLCRQLFIDHLLTIMRNHKAFPLDLQLRVFCPTRKDAYESDWIFTIFQKWVGALRGQEGCRIEPVDVAGKRQWIALGMMDDDADLVKITDEMVKLIPSDL